MSQIILSCAVIRPGEVGIKQKLGKFSNEVIKEGSVLYNPILSKVVKEGTGTPVVFKICNDSTNKAIQEYEDLLTVDPHHEEALDVLGRLGTYLEPRVVLSRCCSARLFLLSSFGKSSNSLRLAFG